MKKNFFYQSIIIFLLFNSTNLYADNLNILPIQSVPDIMISGSQPDGEALFENRGTIQRVGKDEVGEKLIVIDDRLRYFAPNIKYYNNEGGPISYTAFNKGKTVGYSLNDKKEIISLHLTGE